ALSQPISPRYKTRSWLGIGFASQLPGVDPALHLEEFRLQRLVLLELLDPRLLGGELGLELPAQLLAQHGLGLADGLGERPAGLAGHELLFEPLVPLGPRSGPGPRCCGPAVGAGAGAPPPSGAGALRSGRERGADRTRQ